MTVDFTEKEMQLMLALLKTMRWDNPTDVLESLLELKKKLEKSIANGKTVQPDSGSH